MIHDGFLLPIERSEGKTRLQERLERRQVAWLDYVQTPAEEWGFALTLTSGARLVGWATRDHGWETGRSPYRYRLMLRWMPPHKGGTRRSARYFGAGRDGGYASAITPHRELGPDRPVESPDAIQQRVEGQVIVGAGPTREANPEGGERLEIEFRGGGRLRADALPPKPGSRDRADCYLRWIPPPEVRRVWMPGDRPVAPAGIVG